MTADLALIAGAGLLGLAGTPHCAAMCAGPCAALAPGWQFQLGRLGGYATAGAVAAGSVGALASTAAASEALRPLWALVQIAALALGLWLLVTGRQPAFLAPAAGSLAGPSPVPVGAGGASAATTAGSGAGGGWQAVQVVRRRASAPVAGLLWVAWPCALLQSALVMAALASGPVGGGLTMAAFAAASAPGLVAAGWAWRALGRRRAVAVEKAAVRIAGVLLAGAAAWALGHGVWTRLAAWCLPGLFPG